MAITQCPECGHDPVRGATACPQCGRAMTNGTVPRPIPAEVSGWTQHELPADILAWAKQTFDEQEYLAEVREIERTGGVRFEDFIGEVEGQVRRRD